MGPGPQSYLGAKLQWVQVCLHFLMTHAEQVKEEDEGQSRASEQSSNCLSLLRPDPALIDILII